MDLLAKFPGQLRLKKFKDNNASYDELTKALQPKAGRIFYLRNGDDYKYLTAFQQACAPAGMFLDDHLRIQMLITLLI